MPAGEVSASSRLLKSGLVSAAFDAKGQISALSFGAEKIPLSRPLGSLVVYPDMPHLFEAWEIDLQTLSLGKAVETSAKATVSGGGAF